ncbi:sensor histidine kinase [Ekhidna sp.]|uniref:tetratricopeptide repeat-containing sensor histidine kinase n=1 Tax=Ekhidna sp. TaxID=2608089 RepID=UPI0032968BD1
MGKTLSFFLTYMLITTCVHSQVDSLYAALKTATNDSLKGEAYKQLFDFYYETENDSSGTIAELHYEFATKTGDPRLTVEALINLGLYYDVFVGNLDQCLQYYRAAYQIAETNGLRHLKDIAHYMGVAFHVTDDYERAKKYYLEAYLLAQELNDEYRFIASGINLASIFSSQQSFDTAEILFKKILIKSAATGTYHELANMARVNLANLYVRKKQYKSAYPLLKEGYKYQIENRLFRNALQTLDYLVETKIGDNNLNGMDTLISLNKALIDSTQNARIISLGYENLAEAYYAIGDYKNAYNSKKNHFDAYQKLKEDQRAESLYALETKYQNEKQQNEINELKVEAQEAVIASQNRANQRNIFISLSTFFLLLVLFFVVRYKQKNKSNGLLAEKNKVIASALQEKEILLKEIHHRVKNNLQVISSLLNLQAESLSNESALEAITDGQNRVKSMSLIHQRLYLENDLRGVDVNDYLKTLIPQLIHSFTMNKKEIDYKIDVGGIKLDVDTLVPLGLIVNELITNSLKHAFEEVNSGIIELSMREENDQLRVSIKDNGKGLDEASLKNTNSFGWKMIGSLSRKLKAELNIINDEGTVVNIFISRYKMVI